MENKIVGEGTYGCVVEPALECKTPKNYENKVSKVMRKKDAIEELQEYDFLSQFLILINIRSMFLFYVNPN